MLKILHIISGLSTGGAEMALLRMVTHANLQQTKSLVISLTDGGSLLPQFLESGIQVISLDYRRRPFSSTVKLFRLIKSIDPDVVQTWLYHGDLIGGIVSKLAGKENIVWGVHSTNLTSGRTATRIIKKTCSLLSGYIPKRIVCVAEASKIQHIKDGYDAKRIVVIANGFDAEPLDPPGLTSTLRSQIGIPSEKQVIGTVSRLNHDKDIHNLIKAAKIILDNNHRVHFLLIGRGLESDNPMVRKWILESGHPASFTLLGERNDIPTCLNAMDIFCLPSRTEAFPLAVGEAMRAGKVCVVTDVGDAATLVGNTGIVVPKENAQALAEGLNEAMSLPREKRDQMGEMARSRIRGEFSLDKTLSAYQLLYRNIVHEQET